MKLTAFCREKNGECAACLKNSVRIFVEKIIKWGFWSVPVCPSYIYMTGTPVHSKNPILLFFQQIYILNFLNMLHTLRFFLYKMPFIS
jgi:hypothetical protein